MGGSEERHDKNNENSVNSISPLIKTTAPNQPLAFNLCRTSLGKG